MKSLYTLTLSLGAFLLFLLEPLFAKMILPWFGGSAAVWTTCLVFFQGALLLGYLYADNLTRRLPATGLAFLHIGLLLASLFFLPITLHDSWRPQPDSDPVFGILGLLTVSIGIPFVLLSATSPLIQAWYARSHPGKNPYFLFAVSNGASLLALLAFPFLIEPNLTSHQQATLWSWLFGVFVAVCSLSAWLSRNEPTHSNSPIKHPTRHQTPASLRSKLLWLGLSACGSMLLLSVTNQLSQNVAAIPLLWVFPLALYLITFMLAFHRVSLYPRQAILFVLPVAIALMSYAFYDPSFLQDVLTSVLFFGSGLFLTCWFCHGELSRTKPDSKHLTSYYLMISLGGALGAVFVGVLSPRIFSNIYEFPIALGVTALLALGVLQPKGWVPRILWSAAIFTVVFVLTQNLRFNLVGSQYMGRNFYGVLTAAKEKTESGEPYLALYNGVTRHGAQFLNPSRAMEPTAYYSRLSGVGIAMDFLGEKGPIKAGLVGLGAGTLAAYGKPGDIFRFYEINPKVEEVANRFFTFLGQSAAKVEMVTGDARLMLEAEPPQEFDLLALDAFSGDAVPVHLLTKEAFGLYLRHLNPEGVLAIHTSSTYLDLAPVVKVLADDAGYLAFLIHNEADHDRLINASDWVIVSRNLAFLDEIQKGNKTNPIRDIKGLRLWTDDYSNLLQAFLPLN